MGQSCSTIQQRIDRHTVNLQQTQSRVQLLIDTQLKQQFQRQKQLMNKITYIQNSQQLIYQLNDADKTVQHLKVSKYVKNQKYQTFSIQRFLDDKSSIVKFKLYGEKQEHWQVFNLVQTKSLKDQHIRDFALFYYNFNKIKHIDRMNNNFVIADKCDLRVDKNVSSGSVYFVISSQVFNNDIISLKQLGIYMKKNQIYWQDKQFFYIVKKCCRRVKNMHVNRFYIFQDFLIDQTAQVYCMGGFVGTYQWLENQVNEDYRFLAIYLLEVLFGINIEAQSTEQVLKFIQRQESLSKFKRTQSLELIINVFNQRQYADFNLKEEEVNQQFLNIEYYVSSYRYKTQILPPSLILSKKYTQLGFYQKAIDVLFDRLGLLLYDHKINQRHDKKLHFLSNQKKNIKITKPQIQQCFQVIQHIITLKKLVQNNDSYDQQFQLTKQYLKLGILLSWNFRKHGHSNKALLILKRIQKFINLNQHSWLLSLHIAQTNFLIGNTEQAEKYFKDSIRIDINEANVCFLIKFYASVLNWQKAVLLLNQHEKLIAQEYVFQLLVSKSLLSKALCCSNKLKKHENQRFNILNQCYQIIRRVLDRKNVSQYILCEALQILGDCHFYLMQYQQARQAYQKCEAIISSIGFRNKQHKLEKQLQMYDPTYIKTSQSQYKSTIRPYQYAQYLGSGNKNLNKSVQQSINFESFISESQSRQLSFVYQLRIFLNHDKKAIILSSIGNSLLMLKKFQQATKKYQQARNQVSQQNVALKDSIVGNIAICSIEMGKMQGQKFGQNKINEGKKLLQLIMENTQKQTPEKIYSDVNYIFLARQLSAVSNS